MIRVVIALLALWIKSGTISLRFHVIKQHISRRICIRGADESVCVMCQEVNETLVDTPGEECKMCMTLESKVLLLFVELCGSISLLGVFSHVFFENTRLLLSTIGH